jgi:hypothetical protein
MSVLMIIFWKLIWLDTYFVYNCALTEIITKKTWLKKSKHLQ